MCQKLKNFLEQKNIAANWQCDYEPTIDQLMVREGFIIKEIFLKCFIIVIAFIQL
jgi:hypothetical protein